MAPARPVSAQWRSHVPARTSPSFPARAEALDDSALTGRAANVVVQSHRCLQQRPAVAEPDRRGSTLTGPPCQWDRARRMAQRDAREVDPAAVGSCRQEHERTKRLYTTGQHPCRRLSRSSSRHDVSTSRPPLFNCLPGAGALEAGNLGLLRVSAVEWQSLSRRRQGLISGG